MSKGVHDSIGCARHRSVYVCITVKGSRVCEHCNVLAVRKYVRASMVQAYNIAKLVFCSYHHLITLFITTFIAEFGLGREPSVIFECCYFKFLFSIFIMYFAFPYI